MNPFKQFSIYTVASLVNASIPFLLLPILTEHIPVRDFGLLALYQSIILFTLPFVTLGVDGAMSVNYFKVPADRLPAYLVSSSVVAALGFSIAVLAFGLCASLIGSVLGIPRDWLLVVPIICLAHVPVRTALAFFRVSGRPFQFAQKQIALTALNLGSSVVLVVYFALGWQGRVWGILLSHLCLSIALVGTTWVRGHATGTCEKNYVLDILKFGVPLIPHSVGGILIGMADRFFISGLVGLEDLGYYAVAAQLTGILGIVITSVNQVWAPTLFKRLARERTRDEDRNLVGTVYLLFVGIAIAGIASAAILPWTIGTIVPVEYLRASIYIPWLAAGVSFSGFYMVVTNFLFFAEKTHILAYVTFTCGLGCALSNYLLIPRYGAMGAAYSSVITWFLFFVLTSTLVCRVFPLPWMNPSFRIFRASRIH